MAHRVTLIPGDGTGPELTEATRRVLEATAVDFEWDVQEAGVDVMETAGTPLPEETLASVKANKVALKALQERHPERVLATNVEYYSAIVLDVAEIPPPLAPAMFACSRVAGWSAHILEQKRTGRLFRPSARYVGPGVRPASPVA